MSDEKRRTPGPWRQHVSIHDEIYGGESGEVWIATTEHPRDAAFIVKACNAHDELVSALKKARQYIHIDCPVSEFGDNECLPACREARAALRKAGAE